MKKTNPQIKNEYTLKMQDEIDAIEMIADMFFREVTDDDGNTTTKYTPYLEKVGQVNAIARYFLTGIEFEKGEDVYDAVMEDKDIRPLVDKFLISNYDEMTTREQKIMAHVMDEVYEIVSFRKANMLAQVQNEANAVLTYKLLELIEKEQEKTQKEIETSENLNAWVDEQRKYQEELNAVIPIEKQKEFFENFDMDAMSQSIYKQISEGDLHKLNEENVKLTREIREKDKIIDFQQKEFAKEVQKDSVKNVLADKKEDKESKSKATRKRATKKSETKEDSTK